MVARIAAIGIALAILWFGYRRLFPNDEAQIHRVLDRIAEAVGSGAEEGEVGRIARAATLRNELDPQITVDAGPPFQRITGRDALIGTVARLNSAIKDLEIRFVDVEINVEPDRTTARVYMTAEARFRSAQGDRGVEARELDVLFRRIDGAWVVSNIALVRTLSPVTRR